MKISVIGVGYVGLVTGAAFADLGNEVVCADIDADKIACLNRGELPIYEPGLEELVERNTADGRLRFTTDVGAAVAATSVVFIAVNTPPGDEGETDLSAVRAVARTIGEHLNGYKVIVNKSTVPVGTGDLVRRIIEGHRRDATPFDVVSNPEFLREGSALADTFEPERIVIGAPSKRVAMTLVELYASLERPMLVTDVASAELIKYASNAFLAMKISFANAIADVCEQVGADIELVTKGIGSDSRIGRQFLQAGLGYGGSCFPKDVDSLIHTARRLGTPLRLLEEVVKINRERVPRLVARMRQALEGIRGRRIALLGLAFKANTDDVREAKSLELIEALREEGADLAAYDPEAMARVKALHPDITYAQSPYEVVDGADAVVLVTEWREFRFLDLERLRASMRRPLFFDGRNVYEPRLMARAGFEYHSIGRKTLRPSDLVEGAAPEVEAEPKGRVVA